MHYRRLKKSGDPGRKFADNKRHNPKQFLNRICNKKHYPSQCIEWPFGKSVDGYGRIKIDQKEIRVHRYVCQKTYGESHHLTKLTESQVILIISDSRSYSIVAKEFNVSKATVADIKKSRSWKHIPR